MPEIQLRLEFNQNSYILKTIDVVYNTLLSHTKYGRTYENFTDNTCLNSGAVKTYFNINVLISILSTSGIPPLKNYVEFGFRPTILRGLNPNLVKFRDTTFFKSLLLTQKNYLGTDPTWWVFKDPDTTFQVILDIVHFQNLIQNVH